RTSNSGCSGYCRSFNAGVLLAVWLSRGCGSSRAKRLGAILRSLVSCPRGRAFGRWIRAAVSWPNSMHEAQHGQYRALLGASCIVFLIIFFPSVLASLVGG